MVTRLRLSRRRDGLQQPAVIRAERDDLIAFLADKAKNQRMSLMAYGAKCALDWVLDNRSGFQVSKSLDLVTFALKWQRRPSLKTVPTIRRKDLESR